MLLSTVSAAPQAFTVTTSQKAGLIRYHRGHLTIIDREKLETASCECYRATTDLVSRVYADGA